MWAIASLGIEARGVIRTPSLVLLVVGLALGGLILLSGIQRRLISYYLVVIAIIVILMGSFFVWFLHSFYMQTLRENLVNQARLVASLIDEMREHDATAEEIDDFCKILGRDLRVRVTLVDADGVVLADSAQDPALMDNHRDRPEVIGAVGAGEGVEIRYSTTLDEEMFYLAVPLRTTSVTPGQNYAMPVVRLAVPLSRINQAVSNLLMFTIGALFVASLIAMGSAIVFSDKLTGPIRKIGNAAHAIAAGNFTPSLTVAGKDELASLATSIREMGKDLKRKIDQVVSEKNKLDTVVSSMSTGIVLVDHQLDIEMINPAAEKLFDIERDHVIGTPLQKALRHYTLYQNVKAVSQDGQERVLEVNIYYPRAAVLETHLLPVFGLSGQIVGVLLLFHEVTHLRSLEKMRSDFVANVSHELRTPLTTVRGYTETILHADLTRDQLVDFLQIIDRETARLSTLLDNLLDLAQIENEKGYVKKENVNLAVLANEAVHRVEELRQNKQVVIEVDVQSEGLEVLGNSEWLCQALVNILENSIRHGKEGGRITVSLTRSDKTGTVEVTDDGPGIPDVDLPYVFERFYRVDKARSRRSGGTGLGLSIVKHIMEAHGATYALESNASGTVFRFSLALRPWSNPPI